MKLKIIVLLIITTLFSCKKEQEVSTYFADDTKGVKNGGVKMISITTPKGKFNVWTKRIGNNPKIKLLLLNGGPGMSHEYFEAMESFLPKEGIEFIYYDQLGTGFSDNPNDTTMWDLPRYVEEVEQVRKALNLNKDNFYLLGHSWGGILGMQYALKYQDNLKGLIVSNMMASCPKYGEYSKVLAKQMPQDVLKTVKDLEAKKDYTNPKYMGLLMEHFYNKHILRMPVTEWPEPVNRSMGRLNSSLYITMQGPSELGISGKLTNWDVSKELPTITVPTLVVGAKYDTMDPEYMKWMATQFKNGSYLYCANGSHMSLYDDQETYFKGLIEFLKKGN
ncbi:proline iminopeptidase-family hydrolase [Flavobacterium aquatile]|uniref:Proline iminopeptidase n=1 Tax=Flavobacterium aquatile LMG 4008 = ATCC 11947 TaxID=1453498 RepID=A0A095ST94_9FLAO|nr:proline iminopeptidase-family hydrolase [Flavobacterium aquatile]KGD67876.1 proline iminopeptidase [Flavobacterium aquatile LMG 4008 = ATCC 11947]OXA67738.1 proline iminopeptidase [Flavobacterium aquatile] [Flavobacterium aquatile LMG 4008 = ATCC 11947]GEC79993.1 proline iminopeptidase [Flavobacterium aquatile]